MNKHQEIRIIRGLMEQEEWASHTMLIAELQDGCQYKECEEEATHILYWCQNAIQDINLHVVCEGHALEAQRAMHKDAEGPDQSMSVEIHMPEEPEDKEAER